MPVGKIEISTGNTYRDTDEFTEGLKMVQSSAPFLWAKENSLRVRYNRAFNAERYSTVIVFYVELTPVQETEYILRFL